MEKVTLRTVSLILLLLGYSAYSHANETINGQVLYHGIYPHAGVTAMLHDVNGNIIDITSTDGSGNYAFYNVAAGTYSISFEKSGPAGGVTLTDAFLVMLYLFNQYTFTPIQQLAADVDGDGAITWNDYILILVGYLNQGNPFPVGDWVFEPVPPFSTGSRSETKVSGSNSSGDVNGTFVPTKTTGTVYANLPAHDILVRPGQVSMVPVSAGNSFQMTGMHLMLRIPDGIMIRNIESQLQNLNYSVRGNELILTWMDQGLAGEIIHPDASLFSIEAVASDDLAAAMPGTFTVLPESHFIDEKGEVVHGVHIVIPNLKLQSVDEFNLKAYPNPFTTHLTIGVELPSDGNIAVQIFDQCGRMVHEINNAFHSAGTHELRFDGSFLAPGTYFYRVSLTGNENFSRNGSIIKSK